MKETIINLLEFIRLKICIFMGFIGMSGYLISNPLNINLIFVALTSFLIAAGSYSFNNIMDIKEDKINRNKVNPFVFSNESLLITFICFSLGIIFSLFLSFYSIFFTLIGTIISIHYSFFKIKKYFLIKNLYTGFGATLVFLVGALKISIEIVWYYLLISFFIFIISIISDLRDYRGDKFNNFKTIPVFLGYNTAKKIIFLLLGIFSLLILFFSKLSVLLPFVLIISYFIHKNNPSISHSIGGYSFIFLIFWLVL